MTICVGRVEGHENETNLENYLASVIKCSIKNIPWNMFEKLKCFKRQKLFQECGKSVELYRIRRSFTLLCSGWNKYPLRERL